MPQIKKYLFLVGTGTLVQMLRALDAAMSLFIPPQASRNVVQEGTGQKSLTIEVPEPLPDGSHRPHAFVTIATIGALSQCLSEAHTQLQDARYPASLEKRAQMPASLEKAWACINIMNALLANVQQDLQSFQQEQNIAPLQEQQQVDQVVMELHGEVSRLVDEYMIATFF